VLDPRDQTPECMTQKCLALGATQEAARRMVRAVVGRGEFDPKVWGTRYQVPKVLSQAASDLPRLRLDASVTSPVDGFQKLRFGTEDGLALETVLIPLHKAGAVSLCLSSQVGCAMGCVFCATARMKVRRNLATWEIVDQLLQARTIVESQGRRVTGIVFMGMGEPLANYNPVMAAAELFRCSYGASVGARAITISTVGLVPEIDRYTSEGHKFRLTISLGAAIDEKRRKLVPVASRWPLADLMAAARRHALARRQRINLAYVCIGGCNVGEEDALALGELIGDTPTRIDLIDVTDPSGKFQPPSPDEMASFRDALTKHVGQPVVRRYSGGADIRAACGTLAAEAFQEIP
jgi:23S rRNA (adenine2503-C2)-methyltransferase